MTEGAVIAEFAFDQGQIERYARATGDFNPIHLDPEYARRAGLSGPIAHGLLLLGRVAAEILRWSGPEWELEALENQFAEKVHPGEPLSLRLVGEDLSDGADGGGVHGGGRLVRLQLVHADGRVALDRIEARLRRRRPDEMRRLP